MKACVTVGHTGTCNETFTFTAFYLSTRLTVTTPVKITWEGVDCMGTIWGPYTEYSPFPTYCFDDNPLTGKGICDICVTSITDLTTGCVWHFHCCVHLPDPFRESAGSTNGGSSTIAVTNLSVIPNPNKGSFNLSGTLENVSNAKQLNFEIIDMLGQVVYKDAATIENGGINKNITLGDNIASGVYLVKIKDNGVNQVIRFTLDR